MSNVQECHQRVSFKNTIKEYRLRMLFKSIVYEFHLRVSFKMALLVLLLFQKSVLEYESYDQFLFIVTGNLLQKEPSQLWEPS